MPMISRQRDGSAQRVERSDRSLVHSERATRACVTRPTSSSRRGRRAHCGAPWPVGRELRHAGLELDRVVRSAP